MAWLILLVVVGAYVAYVLHLYIGQSRLVYGPTRVIGITPRDHGLEYEDVTLRTEDGVTLHGWYLPHRDARATLLYLHGNGGNLGDCVAQLALLRGLRLEVLAIDYRGYGRSAGHPDEQGTYRDAEAAWRYLTDTRQCPADRIVLYGHSLGGPIAAWVAARHGGGALILEGTFTAFPDVAAAHFPWVGARHLVRYRYPTAELLRSTDIPVLIVHSRDDRIIPPAHAQALFEAAPRPKEQLEIRGSHGQAILQDRERFMPTLDRFLTRHLGG